MKVPHDLSEKLGVAFSLLFKFLWSVNILFKSIEWIAAIDINVYYFLQNAQILVLDFD